MYAPVDNNKRLACVNVHSDQAVSGLFIRLGVIQACSLVTHFHDELALPEITKCVVFVVSLRQ